jgi:hypothetical protein
VTLMRTKRTKTIQKVTRNEPSNPFQNFIKIRFGQMKAGCNTATGSAQWLSRCQLRLHARIRCVIEGVHVQEHQTGAHNRTCILLSGGRDFLTAC